jgi:hypothetical protein
MKFLTTIFLIVGFVFAGGGTIDDSYDYYVFKDSVVFMWWKRNEPYNNIHSGEITDSVFNKRNPQYAKYKKTTYYRYKAGNDFITSFKCVMDDINCGRDYGNGRVVWIRKVVILED